MGDTSTIARMTKLLAFHETNAQALRISLALLNGHATEAAQQNGHAVVAKALALDHTRRNGHSNGHKKRGRPSNAEKALGDVRPYAARIAANRKRTAAFLKNFSTSIPSRPEGGTLKQRGVGTLIRHGYLKSKGDGYVRTEKVFTL